ncbi:MAG: type VI secretion system membrane subunit TssM [Myxococcales bacterium]|nr:type VI secretion system membrane subunit TssM [Myxococcales bacterium]
MWIYLVAVLLIAGIWVGGYFLGLNATIQLVASVGVVALVILVLLFRRWRAQRAALAIERELLKQAEKQAQQSRPDRRAEIQALQTQFQQGIASLKTAKGSGASALYSLPWYMIIGPPGAGKTTALKASGLNFPALDPRGGGFKGVGGTRNCDWWFTNEAILLDTAGRYATERDDHDEWIAFLDMLKRFRPDKPINGVLVALSVTDLANANDEQIDTYAKKLRARIDEVMTRLEMVIPVYVVFTKADLVSGFVEFWSDLRKSERGQIWGATFSLNNPPEDAAKAAETEIEALIKGLHARAIKRVGTERQTDQRQPIYRFPLELATLRTHMVELIGALFAKNNYQETPIFRGIYFTSGTQEGRPMDRVLGSMAQAFGFQPAAAAEVVRPRETEQKSYFVTELFTKVVFPDQNVAARTVREVKRRRLRQLVYAAVAMGIAAVLIVPSSCTFARNLSLVDDTVSIAKDAAKLKWGDPATPSEKIKRLEPLRMHLLKLRDFHDKGPDVTLRWGMYTGDKLYPSARAVYAAQMQVGFSDPAREVIEGRLRSIEGGSTTKGEAYNRAYDDIKLYLMVTDMGKDHLDPVWAAGRLVRLWIAGFKVAPTQELEAELRPHVELWLDMLKKGEVTAWKADRTLVATARKRMLKVPRLDRDYEALVRDASYEIAPVKFSSIFYGTIAPYVTSTLHPSVDGAYTRYGWAKVKEQLEKKKNKLDAEQWVLDDDEKTKDGDSEKHLAALRQRYYERYIEAWKDFLSSITIVPPKGPEDALTMFEALCEPEYPYLRLIRTVDEHINFDTEANAAEKKAGALGDKVSKKVTEKVKTNIGDAGAGALPAMPKATKNPVEKEFARFNAFGAEPPPTEGDTPPPTPLKQYINSLGRLVGHLTDLRDSKMKMDRKILELDRKEAEVIAKKLLGQAGLDAGLDLLRPLLLRPLDFPTGAPVEAPGAPGTPAPKP